MELVKKNAQAIIRFITAYPFKLPESRVVCVYCGLCFEEPAHYGDHMTVEHEDVDYRRAFYQRREGYIKADCTDLRCKMCLSVFDKLIEAAEHLRDTHDIDIDPEEDLGILPFKFEKNKLLCGECGHNSPNIRYQSRHINRHYLKFVCERCGKAYDTQTTLNHHIKESCINEYHRRCQKCKAMFKSAEAKKEHLEKSVRCRQYTCNLCDGRFVSWMHKRKHIEEAHGAPKKTYPCPECTEVFPKNNTLRRHFILNHTNDYFACDQCNHKFIDQDKLDIHKVVHTGKKDHVCQLCEKAFSRRSTLLQHMWLHSEVKKFTCEVCQKPFNQKVCWQTHMKTVHPDFEIKS